LDDVEARAEELVGRLDLEAKVRLCTGASFWATWDEPAAGLRPIVLSDGPAGVRGQAWDERRTSTNLPSPTCMAASWDEDLAERLGRFLATEARAKGVDVLLGPTINLHRSPLGGRHFECFSEDPLLTARIGAAYVRGVQDEGVAATPKHYVANDSETERFTVDTRVGERALRELYLAPFEHLVREAGAWLVMAAYNGVNGATMTENPLLADPLKGEWGFDGVVVSDWRAARSLAAAAPAATDLVMPGPTGPWGADLVAAVRAGSVPESAVDDKVRRLLRLAARVGAWKGVPPAVHSPRGDPNGRDGAALAREAAAAEAVLMRNRGGLLPLDPRRASAGGGGRAWGGSAAESGGWERDRVPRGRGVTGGGVAGGAGAGGRGGAWVGGPDPAGAGAGEPRAGDRPGDRGAGGRGPVPGRGRDGAGCRAPAGRQADLDGAGGRGGDGHGRGHRPAAGPGRRRARHRGGGDRPVPAHRR
jgi:beta-glucosidase-like glycosyl hydrolase